MSQRKAVETAFQAIIMAKFTIKGTILWGSVFPLLLVADAIYIISKNPEEFSILLTSKGALIGGIVFVVMAVIAIVSALTIATGGSPNN